MGDAGPSAEDVDEMKAEEGDGQEKVCACFCCNADPIFQVYDRWRVVAP